MRLVALLLGRRGFEARTAAARWVRHASVGGWGDFDAGLQQQRRPGAVRWRSLATRASPTADPEKLTVVKLKEILDAAGARAGSDSDGIAADVTLTASPETFVAIFEGELALSTAAPEKRLEKWIGAHVKASRR